MEWSDQERCQPDFVTDLIKANEGIFPDRLNRLLLRICLIMRDKLILNVSLEIELTRYVTRS